MSKGHRAFVESMEARRLLASVSGMVWNDLDGDKVKDSREAGKWFSLDGVNDAKVTLFADYSGNGLFDNNEPSTVVSKDGTYKINIDGPRPVAVRTHYVIDPATQKNTAIFGMVPVVVITSTSQDITNVNVPLQKGAVVTGTFYTDENANGKLDNNEVKRGRSQVFVDINDDGIRENEEPFVPLDAPLGSTDYKYTIRVPLGASKLRVVRIFETDKINIDPVNVTAEAGKLYTRDFRIVPEMILKGRLFDDRNGNGKRNQGEPWVQGIRVWFDYDQKNTWDKETEPSAVSDSGGNYTLTNRKTTGLFGLNVRFRSSFSNTITSTLNLNRIVFKTIQETQSYNYGFKAGSISMQVFNDPDKSKSITQGDSPLQYMAVFLDTNKNGIQNSGEPSVLTGEDGIAKFENLAPGTYTIVVRYSKKYVATFATNTYEIILAPFENRRTEFGVRLA